MWEGWDDLPAHEAPTSLPESQEEGREAFCPLLFAATKGGRGICGDVQCGSCDYLRLFIGQKEVLWLCSSCSPGARSLPFWKDGNCEACGYESVVLGLCQIVA